MINLKDSRKKIDPLDELAKAIVYQAVLDWRYLILKGKTYEVIDHVLVGFDELKRFFKSDYCQLLINTDPKSILWQLEKELEAK